MDYVIGWQEYTEEFNGEKVTMQLRPLTVAGMMILAPYMRGYSGGDADGVAVAIDSFKLQQIAKDLFPGHVKDIAGFTVNGEPPTIETLANETMFNPLTVSIVGQLAIISQLRKIDEKNSGAPSGSTTKDGAARPTLKDSLPESG